MVQSSSEIRQHAVETTGVARREVVRLAEVALTLRRLLGQDVAAVGMARLVLAGSGLPEALGRAPMRLDLGHCCVLVGTSSTGPGGGLRHGFRPALAGLMAADPKGAAAGPTGPRTRGGGPSRALCTARGRAGKSREGRPERPRPRAAQGGGIASGADGAWRHHFFLGAIIMTICRPSMRGRDSITMSSPRSASIRCSMPRPSSWWLISRPRKRMLTLILSPSSRKP